ncbi:MAG: hypothetical protein CVU97_05205 [Firmicutes bacterium HGW-Firmicutes-21]|nr:MAG: hypothetical protein CVU97_05205 [Firmicutes bacterium HGW-Firmicutes-21]
MSEYAVEIRRKLHKHPEIGFELPVTLQLVRTELDNMGVKYTEKYGDSSIVATINEEKAHHTIAFRADMDALPITELNDIPYKSQIDGCMHACGHDIHTAILLGTIRELNSVREKLNCRVRFIFQPAEEYSVSGAKLMAENGVMDDIDEIIACHVCPYTDVGSVSISEGPQNANSYGFTVEFFGKNAHVANQHRGTDAIAMAVKAYIAFEFMTAKEISADDKCLFNIGAFNGGITNNIICDHCNMFGTFRTYDDRVNDYFIKRIDAIAEAVASESGGRSRVTGGKFLPYVYNDEKVTEKLKTAAARVVGAENIHVRKRTMDSEDFSYFANLKPGMMFWLGVRNESSGKCSTLHQSDFNPDEDCIDVGIGIFTSYVLNNN